MTGLLLLGGLVAPIAAPATAVDAQAGFTDLTLGADEFSFDPDISTDGSTIVFRSLATNVIPEQPFDRFQFRGYVYDTATGEIEIVGGNTFVQSIAVNGDGSKAVVSTIQNFDPNDTEGLDVYLWDRQSDTYTWLTPNRPANYEFPDIQISDDGTRVAMAAVEFVNGFGVPVDRGVQLWDATTGETRTVIDSNQGLAFSKDGTTIAVSGNTLRLLNVDDGVVEEIDTPNRAALSADASIVVFQNQSPSMTVLNRTTGEKVEVSSDPRAVVLDVSADGSKVVLNTRGFDDLVNPDQAPSITLWSPRTNSTGIVANSSSFAQASIAGDNETIVFAVDYQILVNKADLPAKVAAQPRVDTARPSVPGRVSLQSGPTETSVTLGFGRSSDNVAVASYNIYLNKQLFTTVESTDSFITVELTGLEPGTDYFAYVRAVDTSGNIGWRTGYRSFTTRLGEIDTQRPSVPAFPASLGQAGQVTWGPSTDDQGVAGYRVYDAATRKVLAESSSLTTVLPSGTYRVYVRAVDTSGNVGWRTSIRTVVVPAKN